MWTKVRVAARRREWLADKDSWLGSFLMLSPDESYNAQAYRSVPDIPSIILYLTHIFCIHSFLCVAI